MKLDSASLTNVISRCFDYSMDQRFSQQQRSAFLATGKRLRGSLLNLLSAHFQEGDQRVLAANASIGAVNESLARQAKVLASTAEALDSVARLVGVVDELIGLAVGFV